MKRCPLCSKEMLDGENKCKHCGYALETISVEDKIKTIKVQNVLANQAKKVGEQLYCCVFF